MSKALQLGTWLSIGSPVVSELAALCALDWVLLDLEHGEETEAAVPTQLRALRGSSTLGIVRVESLQPQRIGRILDFGASGVMVPHVESGGAARSLVSAALYPPAGCRGFSRSVRSMGYGVIPEHETPRPILIAQIESMAGVAAADEIAAVEGIDGVFVGPADLRRDLAARGDKNVEPLFEGCLAAVLRAAQNRGKKAGLLVRDSAELEARVRQGFEFLAFQSDLAFLRGAFEQIGRAARVFRGPDGKA